MTSTTNTAASAEGQATPQFTGPWNINGLGPRQTKGVREAISAVMWEAKSIVEITGVRGISEHRSKTVLMVGGVPRADLLDFIGHIEREVTPKNHLFIVQQLMEAVSAMKAKPVEVDHRREPPTAEESAFKDAERQAQQQKRDEQKTALELCWLELDRIRPSWAQALIVATLKEDRSELQTDYYNHTTTRRVAIGWRSGSREDFRQLRQAANGFPETKHLGPGCSRCKVRATWFPDDPNHEDFKYGHVAPSGYELDGEYFDRRSGAEAAIAASVSGGEDMRLTRDNVPGTVRYTIDEDDIEHRDNYSMGHGNWLGISRHSGWEVTSRSLEYARTELYEIAIPKLNQHRDSATEAPPAIGPAAEPAGAHGATLTENHDKDGYEIHFPGRPSAAVLERLKANGWRWSRLSKCWYTRRTPAAKTFADAFIQQP